MASAREEQQQPYEGGGFGAGGKFRKRPFRKTTHTTPYDRPPTAFRNPSNNNNNNNGGWLSKLVDPAHRLITSSAHRLFSTVFRKRLPPPPPPPPPQPPSPDANFEARNKQQEVVATDYPGAQKGAIDKSNGPSDSSSGGELTELEQILQQKTFTRSEIDRLTALLNSRTVDLAIEDQEKRSEVVPLKQVASTDRLEAFPRTSSLENMIESKEFCRTPAPENRISRQLVSTPVVSSTVLDRDVSSPTELVELAKSYMHKRPISPTMLGFRSQSIKENSASIYTHNLTSPSKLPFTPLVPRTSGHVEARENGFITPTPRSRGRSAIYSMARTPYSRVHPTTSLKGADNALDVYAGPSSSSQYAQDQSLLSRSKQGALKRRSSVLDNDIGSDGAIRRIRQKPNVLSSRGLSLPVYGSPLSSSGTRLGSEVARNPSTSELKPLSLDEPKLNFIKPSTENGENVLPNTSVPSKSSEMASKILQQLDKLVSPKDKSSQLKVLNAMDKSPSRLSPSMLRGQALKSLEDVDSSKFLGDVQNNKMLGGSLDKTRIDAREFTSQREDKVKENGPLKHDSAYGKSTPLVNGRDCIVPEVIDEDSTLPRKEAGPSIVTSVPAAYPHKKRAFRMSAHEDFVDLDDDSHPNGDASNSLVEGREKVNPSLAERKSSLSEDVKVEKASALTEIKPVASEMNQKTDVGTLAGSMTAEKSTNLMFQSTPSPSTTVPPTVFDTVSSLTSDSATPRKESNSSPTFDIGGKIASTRNTDAASPIFDFNSADKVPPSQFTFSSSSASEYGTVKFGASDSKPETSSKLFTGAADAIDSVSKLVEPDKANIGLSFRTPEIAIPSTSSTSSIFSFGTTPSDVNLNNGSSASTSSAPVVFSNLTSQNSSNGLLFTNSGSNVSSASTTNASSSGSVSTSAPALSLPAACVFNFGSSKTSADVAPVSETSSVPAAAVFQFGISTASTAVAPASETSSVPVSPVFKLGSSTAPTAVAPVLETSSAPAAPGFKFSTSSTAVPLVLETKDGAREAINTKQDLSIGNLSNTPFNGSSSVSTGSTLFGFSAAATTSTSATQSQGSTVGSGSASAPSSQVSPAGSGRATFTQSIPFQFGSSGSSLSFGLTGSTALSSGSSPFGSTTTAKPFDSGTTGLGSSSQANLVSSSSSSTPSLFGSNWQQPPKSSIFGFNSTPSTGFSFGATSATSSTSNSSPAIFGATSVASATNGAPTMFGSSNGASASSLFSFNSSSGPASTQPVYGNPSPTFAFGASSVNNDQMNMEDRMAEDTVHASATISPGFGQQIISPSPSTFPFGSAPTSAGNPFQFGSQQNLANPQNSSPFQGSGSFGHGNNFSLGSGGSGVDKSNRRFIKVKSKQRKK